MATIERAYRADVAHSDWRRVLPASRSRLRRALPGYSHRGASVEEDRPDCRLRPSDGAARPRPTIARRENGRRSYARCARSRGEYGCRRATDVRRTDAPVAASTTRITAPELAAWNRAARFPASRRVALLQGLGRAAPPLCGAAGDRNQTTFTSHATIGRCSSTSESRTESVHLRMRAVAVCFLTPRQELNIRWTAPLGLERQSACTNHLQRSPRK